MARLLRILLVAAIVGLSLFVLWRLGHKAAPEPAEASLAGTWRDANLVVDLRADGLYYTLLADTAGGVAPSECGRWHVSGGTLQMRASWHAEAAGPLRLSQPGFHLGTWQGDPPASIELLTAKAQTGSQRATAADSRTLRRAAAPASEAMPAEARHAFEKSCGMHLPD